MRDGKRAAGSARFPLHSCAPASGRGAEQNSRSLSPPLWPARAFASVYVSPWVLHCAKSSPLFPRCTRPLSPSLSRSILLCRLLLNICYLPNRTQTIIAKGPLWCVCKYVGPFADRQNWFLWFSSADKTNGIRSDKLPASISSSRFCAWACVWHRKHDFFPRRLQRELWLIFIPLSLIVQQHYLSFAAQSEQKRHKLMPGGERWRPSHPRRKKGLVPEVGRSVARPPARSFRRSFSAAGKTRLYLSIFPSIYAGRAVRHCWDFHAHRCKWRFLSCFRRRRTPSCQANAGLDPLRRGCKTALLLASNS